MTSPSIALPFGRPASPLLILDLANNHNGSVEHGKAIIDSAAKALEDVDFPSAIKFQYRDLNTLIHPDHQGNHNFKYIKRFEETRISDEEYLELIAYSRKSGFLVACTPFDEISVQKVVDHGFDIIKVASAYATDWPLLTEITKHDLPVIVSTGGLSIHDTDRVAAFMAKRVSQIALMHCVAVYPTPDNQLALNRIDMLKKRYKDVPIGYSTHENPKNVVAGGLALAKGAQIMERHIGLEADGMAVNNYSSQYAELKNWATGLQEASLMLAGMDDASYYNEIERESVRALRRGVYALTALKAGAEITDKDVTFQIPVFDSQLTANEWSKLEQKRAVADIDAEAMLTTENISITETDAVITRIIERSKLHFESAGVIVPNRSAVELSHHYGIERFDEFGVVMVTVVNRDYCKKVIGVFPGQTNPEHFHKKKEETFVCLSGTLVVNLAGETHNLTPGDIITVEVGTPHSFSSPDGAVFEEISSTHYANDSFYADELINQNTNRKTKISVWSLAE